MFLYFIIPSLIDPAKDGILRVERHLIPLFISFGKFVLKLCNDVRYADGDVNAPVINAVLETFRPFFIGFCGAVVTRVSNVYEGRKGKGRGS